MPVAGAAIGAVGKIAGGLLGKKGGGGGSSAPALDFTGLMASPTSVANTAGNSEVLKSNNSFKELAERFPDNPAYALASKVDDIFVPEIKTVE